MSEATQMSTDATSANLAHLAGKFLTFRLAEEEYGLEIMKVQEIIGLMPITHVPRTPDYVRGVINLRGRIVPTIELRAKFGLPSVPDTDKTCIIVVEVISAKGNINVGILVDEVAEVLDINETELDEPPEFGTSLDTDFIMGVGLVKNTVKILLDIDKVLTMEEVSDMQSIAAS